MPFLPDGGSTIANLVQSAALHSHTSKYEESKITKQKKGPPFTRDESNPLMEDVKRGIMRQMLSISIPGVKQARSDRIKRCKITQHVDSPRLRHHRPR